MFEALQGTAHRGPLSTSATARRHSTSLSNTDVGSSVSELNNVQLYVVVPDEPNGLALRFD
jgi:hypothetical protein